LHNAYAQPLDNKIDEVIQITSNSLGILWDFADL